MKANDIFSYAFSAIKLRKLRAGLTTLGVVIGIAAIVALLSITQGLQVTITAQLQKGFATNTLIVSTGGGLGVGTENGFSLLVNDTQTINDIQNVTATLAIIQRGGYVKSGDQTRRVTIVGVNFTEYAAFYSAFAVEDGAIPSNPEDNMVVVGKRISDPWANGTIFCNVGDEVEIIWTNTTARPLANETYAANVVAVLQEIGGGFGVGGPSDTSMYVPVSQAQKFFGTEKCDMIIVELNSDDKATIDSVSKAIREAFSNQVSVISSTAVLNTLSSVFSTIELFLAGIAAISLLVAGIGIMNIMIVSLMERTREIGILKALGMKSRTVLMIFLGESAIIGLLGAVIGLILGWGLANIVTVLLSGRNATGFGNQAAQTRGFAMAITPVLTPTVIVLALAFGLCISIVFALYPAWRASKLKPVEALRYE